MFAFPVCLCLLSVCCYVVVVLRSPPRFGCCFAVLLLRVLFNVFVCVVLVCCLCVFVFCAFVFVF